MLIAPSTRGGSFGRLGEGTPRKTSGMPAKALHPDHAEFFTALGRRIKELRKERGLSLHDMVVKHGYYQSQWQKYEKGGPVTVDSLLRMATCFGLTLGALINGLNDQFPRQLAPEGDAKKPSVRSPTPAAAKVLTKGVAVKLQKKDTESKL